MSWDSRVLRNRNLEVPEIGLDCSGVWTNLLNSERPNLEDEPVDFARNSAQLGEPRPLQHAGASICVNENLVDRL